MLMQVGGEGDRPTFFEMVAAQQITGSLRAALLYSLGVIAQRRPSVHRLIDYSDEAYAVLMLALEAHNLRTTDASFSEALYGLRRQSVRLEGSKGQRNTGLSRKQRSLSLLFLVGLPYLKSKLQNAYTAQRESMLQNALFAIPDDDVTLVVAPSSSSTSSASTFYQRLKRSILRICAKCFPWIHATHEGLAFAYQLLYLLEATRYYSPALHLIAVHVRRASGQELMNAAKHVEDRRSNDYQRVWGPPALQTVQRGVLKSAYTALDYAQTGLIAAVFLFKMMEWWYQSAEERVMTPTIYPPPPPPPAPKVHFMGLGLLLLLEHALLRQLGQLHHIRVGNCLKSAVFSRLRKMDLHYHRTDAFVHFATRPGRIRPWRLRLASSSAMLAFTNIFLSINVAL